MSDYKLLPVGATPPNSRPNENQQPGQPAGVKKMGEFTDSGGEAVPEARLRAIEGDLNAYRSVWVQYDREHVRALQAERRALLAEKCGCGGLCDPNHPCPMAYAAR